MFTKFINKTFNKVVDEITNLCALGFTEDDLEMFEAFLRFEDFEDIFVRGKPSEEVVGVDINQYLRAQPDYIKDYIETDFNVQDFMSNCFVETQKVSKKQKVRDQRPKVNLLIDRFAPMTSLLYEFSQFTVNNTKLPLIAVIVNSSKKEYDTEMLTKIFNSFVSNQEIFVDFVFVDRPNLNKIVKHFDEKYKIETVYSDSDFSTFIEMQIVANFKDNNHLNLKTPEEDSYELYQNDKSLIYASDRALENKSFSEYKKYVPEEYYNLYSEIQRLYNVEKDS